LKTASHLERNSFEGAESECGEAAIKLAFDTATKPDERLAKIILADPHRIYRKWLLEEYGALKGRDPEAYSRLRCADPSRRCPVQIGVVAGQCGHGGKVDASGNAAAPLSTTSPFWHGPRRPGGRMAKATWPNRAALALASFTIASRASTFDASFRNAMEGSTRILSGPEVN
jgi:hypothetical protein